MNKTFKEKYENWLKNHPDAHLKDETGTPHLWWVINCLGDLGINVLDQESGKEECPKCIKGIYPHEHCANCGRSDCNQFQRKCEVKPMEECRESTPDKWEDSEELHKLFVNHAEGFGGAELIIKFIRNLLNSERERLISVIEGLKKKPDEYELSSEEDYYNEAIDDVINKFKIN